MQRIYIMGIKTLDQSAKELKLSIDKLHKARLEFTKAYEASIDAQIEDTRDKLNDDRFDDKFDFTTRQDWSQR